MQTEINVQIGNKAPAVYMGEVRSQCESGELKYGSLSDVAALQDNLVQNDIPEDIFEMNIDGYSSFLEKRRALMANRVKEYYRSL